MPLKEQRKKRWMGHNLKKKKTLQAYCSLRYGHRGPLRVWIINFSIIHCQKYTIQTLSSGRIRISLAEKSCVAWDP